MRILQINHNTVYVLNQLWSFEQPILEAAQVEDKILIVFQPEESGYSVDNLFCYTLQKQLLWRITSPDDDLAGSLRFPYVGLSIENKQFGIVDFYGRRFIFDIQTGKLLSMDIVK